MKNQCHITIIKNGKRVDLDEIINYTQSPVYEVIRIIEGTPLFFREHMERFRASLELVEYKCDYSDEMIFNQIKELVELTDLKNNNVRLEYGLTELGMDLVLFMVNSEYPKESFYENGAMTITANVVRENPHAKVVNAQYLEKIAKLKEASSAYEIILMDSNRKIAEGSKSNLFFVKGDTIYSAKASDILIGITRLELMRVFSALHLKYVELDIFEDQLSEFDACFLSGTSIGVLPIEYMNEIKYNSALNDVIIKLRKAYQAVVENNLEYTRRLYL